jgi:hypothetical protein
MSDSNFATGSGGDVGEIATMADGFGRSARLTHLVRRNAIVLPRSMSSSGAFVRWSTSAVDWTRREEMAISLSVLSVACFVGAAISFVRYDSKYFDLLILSGVIFIATAMPSFEVDASLEELKSINHNLVSIQTAMENLQRK